MVEHMWPLRPQVAAGSRVLVVLLAAVSALGADSSVPSRSLAQLAQRQFAHYVLTDCEKKVLQEAPMGGIALCNLTADEKNSPRAGTYRSLQPYDVRAPLIRWLYVNGTASALVDPKGIRIQGARIRYQLDLAAMTARFPLWLKECRLDKDLDISFARIPALDLSGSRARTIVAEGLVVHGDLNLKERFYSQGGVYLIGSKLDGDLDCRGGTFIEQRDEALAKPCNIALDERCNKALDADHAKIGGSVFLKDGFRAEGEVRFLGSQIGMNLQAADATILNASPNTSGQALNLEGASIGNDVQLTSRFHAAGLLALTGATVNGDLILARVELRPLSGLIAQRATVKGILVWMDIVKDENLKLDVRDMHAEELEDDAQSWPVNGNLFLDGFQYSRLVGKKTPRTVPDRLNWISRQPAKEPNGGRTAFNPQPYKQLAAVFKSAGEDDAARAVLISMEDARHAHDDPSGLGRLWGETLLFTFSYGYEPWRALEPSFAVVALGWLLFGIGNCLGVMAPSEKEAFDLFDKDRPVRHYPRLFSFIYSLDVFLPIINLGLKDKWLPNSNKLLGKALCVWMWVEILLGWILTSLFVAALTGLVRTV